MRRQAPKNLRPADRGLVHLYVGDGKGKTTAAVGTAVRARGYGWPVLFLQFMKEAKWPSGERESLKKLGIDVQAMGEGFYKILNDRKSPDAHRRAATEALLFATEQLYAGKYQLIVLDELGTAIDDGLLDREPVEQMVRAKNTQENAKQVHLIMTGHKRWKWLEKYCDLVTDMKMVKHPYYRGIIATKGIDY